jgi:hypothetical protein
MAEEEARMMRVEPEKLTQSLLIARSFCKNKCVMF